MSSPVDEVLRDLGRTLDTLALDWYLFGAQAAFIRRAPRMTADVDVTVLPGSVSTTDMVSKLEADFELRVPDRDGFVAQTRVVPLVHRSTMMPLDLVLGGPGLEEHFLSRCESMTIGGREVRVPVAEDLVLMKLLAGRPLDLDDATALIRAGADPSEIEPMVEAVAEGLGEDDIRQAFTEVKRRVHR